MEKTRVLVADDHPLVRDSIVLLLQKQNDFEVVGQAADGEEAVKMVGELSPNVVVMDIEMPKVDGLEATKQIKATHPEASVLALTVHDDEEYVAAMLEAGAAGYLLKSVYGEGLVQAIRAVRLGEYVFDPQVGRKVLGSLPSRTGQPEQPKVISKLSTREIEILKLVAKGMTNSEMAAALFVSLRTVKGHLIEIFSKLAVGSRTEAIITCLRAGILSVDDL